MIKICDFIGVEASSNYISRVDKQKINPATRKAMPKNIAAYLANLHYDEIKNLSKHLGGYTNDWLKYADELLDRS